jgi:hypothetical protein
MHDIDDRKAGDSDLELCGIVVEVTSGVFHWDFGLQG